MIKNDGIFDKIVILTDAYNEICTQILSINCRYREKIEDKNYFYKRSIMKRYALSKDKEILQIVQYLKTHNLKVFNYEFADKYKKLDCEIYLDETCGLYYVNRHGKTMYFSKKYENKEQVKRYYQSICIEQDELSPHRYLTEDFDVKDNGVIVDVGVAEGNFSLDIIDKVKKNIFSRNRSVLD